MTIEAERSPVAGAGLPPVPEQGQVVNVRGSNWAVAHVRQQGLPRSPADEGTAGLTHVVDLQSLDEDRLGEELSVVWELEVGHTVAPDQGLPESISADRFDDPNTLAAFVDAVRWGAVTSADADSYQAPFRSGADVKAYQLEPLRRALQSARTNMLLADDVGLGKTIEAGLVIQELLLRHRARSVVVVCPPSLCLKWQDEMREKFGLDFVNVITLDVLPEEIGELPESEKYVSIEVIQPGERSGQRALLSVDRFNKLAASGDMHAILLNAVAEQQPRRAEQPRRRGRGIRNGQASGKRKVEWGLPHRGRISPEEAAYVREHLDEVQKLRSERGVPLLDPADPRTKERYGL